MYGHPAHEGKAGLITPYSPGFCDSCNRVRVSSTGALKLCLFGEREVPLRSYLQRDAQRHDLVALIASSSWSHAFLTEKKYRPGEFVSRGKGDYAAVMAILDPDRAA